MMASKQGPKASAQKKSMTYGKFAKRRLLSTQGSTDESSLYDFPDTESSGSPSPLNKTTVPSTSRPKPDKKPSSSNGGHAASGSKSSPLSRRPDEDKKRSHATAFARDASQKKPLASGARASVASTSSPKATAKAPGASKAIPAARVPASKPRVSEEPPSARSKVAPKASPPKVRPLVKTKPVLQKPQEVPRSVDSQPPPRRRKRLIDTLSAQRVQSPDSGTDDSEDDPDRTIIPGSQTPSTQNSAPDFELRATTAATSNPLRTPASKKIKHTYSQARSIRSDTQQSTDPFGLGPDPLTESLLASPPAKPNLGAFDLPADEFDLDDDDNEPKLGIKSVHELRLAGANSRFTDEMEDLLSRIGTPSIPTSSMRRNALLELSQKLQREEFAVRFRDHAARDNVAKDIGDEEDVICGFALAASLVIFLSSKTAPNLVQHLAEERIGKLLERMLQLPQDVDVIAAQRATNLSKNSRKTVAGIKSALSNMEIWYNRLPIDISPRTIALQLMNILHRYLDPRHREQLLEDAKVELDAIVKQQAIEGSEDEVEFALSATILECESGIATPTGQAWILKHASHSARLLQKILEKRSKRRDEIETAILKVAINTTNTKTGAEPFAQPTLLSSLIACICDGLGQVQSAVEKGTFEAAIYEQLLLLLGVTINVLEHCPPARASMANSDLSRLSTAFFDSHKTINDADSEDKSKVSVALGYLAVTLGYLSLDQQVRSLIAERTKGAGMRELIDSIRQFIGIYRSVDSNVQELEGLVNELQRHGR